MLQRLGRRREDRRQEPERCEKQARQVVCGRETDIEFHHAHRAPGDRERPGNSIQATRRKPLDSGVDSRVYAEHGMGQRLQIGQVARETGLTVDAIRFYEKQRLLRRPSRTEGGFRVFATKDVENIHFIRRAQELGFSLNEIRELLVLQSEDLAACSHVRDLLETKLGAVRSKISELQKLEDQLAADLKKCEGALRGGKTAAHKCCPVLEEISAPIDVRAGR